MNGNYIGISPEQEDTIGLHASEIRVPFNLHISLALALADFHFYLHISLYTKNDSFRENESYAM